MQCLAYLPAKVKLNYGLQARDHLILLLDETYAMRVNAMAGLFASTKEYHVSQYYRMCVKYLCTMEKAIRRIYPIYRKYQHCETVNIDIFIIRVWSLSIAAIE